MPTNSDTELMKHHLSFCCLALKMWFFSSLRIQCMKKFKNLSFDFSYFYILKGTIYLKCALRP